MVKYKNLNNVSQKVLDMIPPMPKEVVFQMVNGHPNNDLDRDHREKVPFFYGKTQLQTKIKIKDPETGRFVDVGVPMEVGENDNIISFWPFLAGKDQPIFNGKFSLMSGKAIDEQLYEIFWLSPEREGSPFADSTIKPVFRIVNYGEENKKTLNRLDTLKKAIATLDTFQEEDYANIAASQNWSETEPEAIKAKVGTLAHSKPDVFNTLAGNPDTIIKANIKRAFDKEILSYDHVSGKISLGDTELFTVAKDSRGDLLGAFATWQKSATNGKSVYDGIVKQLQASKIEEPVANE